jgi:hypothetical protein
VASWHRLPMPVAFRPVLPPLALWQARRRFERSQVLERLIAGLTAGSIAQRLCVDPWAED